MLLSGCQHPTSGDPRTEPPLVRTAVVQSQASSLTRSFTGTVAARVQSDIGFRVSGKVLERLVSSGQRVRRGQPLLRLDDVDLKLALDAQEQAVVAAAARARQATDDEGQVVGAGQTVVRLAQHGPRDAVVQLPETLRPSLGSSAQATLYGRAGAVIPTHLRELSSAADPLTRTCQAKYVLEGPLADAALGATVTVIIPEDGAPRGLRVPIGAVLDAGGGPGVWTVVEPPARVIWRPIQVNGIDDDTLRVSDGLKQGDRVVALGAHLLHEGQEVRLATEASAREAAQEGARQP